MTSCKWFFRISCVLAMIMGIGFAGPAMAKGQGGGKPPKDDPPPAAFTPEIVYTNVRKGGKLELVVTDKDGVNSATVLSLSSIDHASWSTDGMALIFEGIIDNVRGIYRLSLFDAEGNLAPGDPILITTVNGPLSGFLASSPVIETDGSFWIAYSDVPSAGESSAKDIWVVNSATGQPINLTNTPDRNELDPTWAPDGIRLAIVSTPPDQSSFPRDVEIVELNFLESGPSIAGLPVSLIQANENLMVDNPLKEQEWRWPDWANEGEVLVLINTTDRQIWALPTDPALVASDAVKLTDDVPDIFRSRPGWSPDNTQLIYDRQGIGGACGLGPREPRKVIIAELDDPVMPTLLTICSGNEIGEGRHADWWRGAAP